MSKKLRHEESTKFVGKMLFVVMVLLIVSIVLGTNDSHAFEPAPGLYWNPQESGRGFSVDQQNGVVVVAAYVYREDMTPVWYLAAAPLVDGRRLNADLLEFDQGQCLGCPYQEPVVVGSVGRLEIVFTGDQSATMTLNGESTDVIRQNFGFADGNRGMLGEWVFVYDISGSTFARRYAFSRLETTTSGAELFLDPDSRAGGRCDTDGTCIVAQIATNGDLLRGFSFIRTVDKLTGNFVAPTSGRLSPMEGYHSAPPAQRRSLRFDRTLANALEAHL